MNTSYIFIFTCILLFSNSTLAYRIYSYPHEVYDESILEPKTMMITPSEINIPWSQYSIPSMYQILDQRIRRGWGGGRRSISK